MAHPDAGFFPALLDALPDVVLVYPLGPDGPSPILWANAAAERLYGYSAEELREMRVTDILQPGSTSVPDAMHRLRTETRAQFESVHITREGERIPMLTNARLAPVDERLCVIAVCRDDRERRSFQTGLARENLRLERTAATSERDRAAFAEDLRILHRIVTAEHASTRERLDAFLRAGCEMFDLPIGILAETPEDQASGGRLYRLEAAVAPDPEIHPGVTIPLEEAFCDAVFESKRTVSHADASADIPEHPACRDRGFRAYIGTPVYVEGEWYGTVNFVSPEPRKGGFRPTEHELIEVMASTLGREIALARTAAARDAEIAWHRTVAHTVNDAVVHLGPGGAVAFANEAAGALLDAAGRLRTDRVDRDGRPLAPEAFPERVAQREGAPAHSGLVGLGEEGARQWYSITASPVDPDADGVSEGVVAVFRDVTAVRASARRAVQARDLLGSVLTATVEGVMAFRSVRDEDGEIADFEWLLVNPRAEAIVGRSRDALVGHRMLEVFPGNRDSGLFDAYVGVVESGETFQTTVPYAHDGMDTAFRLYAVPLPAADGFTVSFVEILEAPPEAAPPEATPAEASGAMPAVP